MTDVKSWLFLALALLINAPNGVFINVSKELGHICPSTELRNQLQFQGIIILSLGYTGLQTTLMTMPSGAVQLITCVGARYITPSNILGLSLT
jgi:hypothetical protein